MKKKDLKTLDVIELNGGDRFVVFRGMQKGPDFFTDGNYESNLTLMKDDMKMSNGRYVHKVYSLKRKKDMYNITDSNLDLKWERNTITIKSEEMGRWDASYYNGKLVVLNEKESYDGEKILVPIGDGKGISDSDDTFEVIVNRTKTVPFDLETGDVIPEDFTGNYKPSPGELCWFWTTSDDVVLAYYDKQSFSDYQARYTRQDRNGHFVQSYKYCERYAGKPPFKVKC